MLPFILKLSPFISVTSIKNSAGDTVSIIVILAVSTMLVSLFIRTYTTSVLFRFSTVTILSPLANVGFIHIPDVLCI